ncbi:hypothetical protein [Pseudomonas sp. GZD-209]|uniref:hypothetical protein n=1 Tax=Pseudomonas sp. GZD-209 TaxID=3404807 RepID=UPI003BB49193
MSEMEKLAALLQRQKDDEIDARAKAEVEHGLWISSLHELFKQLELWLAPLVTNQTAQVKRGWVSISEKPVPALERTYEAPMMGLMIKDKAIEIKPVARYVIGAHGLVEFGNEAQGWKLTRHLLDGVECWKIRYVFMRQPSPNNDLTSDSFAQAIGQLLQGIK